MNVENLGRQAINIIRDNWGLPNRGFLAGGSIANIIWELVSGNKAVVNDIDVFIFNDYIKYDSERKDHIFKYKEDEVNYFEDYSGLSFCSITKDFYEIKESTRDGIYNNVTYDSNIKDPMLILKSFDLNSTRVGYSIEEDKLYWTEDFEEFLKDGSLKISNLRTPAHTAIRICKKQKDLNCKLDDLEYKILQHALSFSFSDIIKLRFKERYFDMYNNNIDSLKDKFIIERDIELEKHVLSRYGESTELYFLKSNYNNLDKKKANNSNATNTFEKIFGLEDLELTTKLNYRTNIFNDNSINSIHRSSEFLFYIRNIYGNDKLSTIWNKLRIFFVTKDYFDKEISIEDIELLGRIINYSPNSIKNLIGYKISEQIEIVKKILNSYVEDPLIGISVLEKIKINKDIELDENTLLIMELAVRKDIVNDTKGKVNKILNISN